VFDFYGEAHGRGLGCHGCSFWMQGKPAINRAAIMPVKGPIRE
jgi:hypothetical protein